MLFDFDNIQGPPIEEFRDYYSIAHERTDYLPKRIQEFGIILISLMEAKPSLDAKSIEYVTKFLEGFCSSSDNYNKLTQEGMDFVSQILNSDNEFIKEVVKNIRC